MVDPCKACAEIICMGICADQVQYKQEYQEMTDRIRQQIIKLNNNMRCFEICSLERESHMADSLNNNINL